MITSAEARSQSILTRGTPLFFASGLSDASAALRYGLLTEVTSAAELPGRLQVWIDRIARRDADALRFSKHAIDLTAAGQPGTAYDLLAQGLLVLRNRTEPQ